MSWIGPAIMAGGMLANTGLGMMFQGNNSWSSKNYDKMSKDRLQWTFEGIQQAQDRGIPLETWLGRGGSHFPGPQMPAQGRRGGSGHSLARAVESVTGMIGEVLDRQERQRSRERMHKERMEMEREKLKILQATRSGQGGAVLDWRAPVSGVSGSTPGARLGDFLASGSALPGPTEREPGEAVEFFTKDLPGLIDMIASGRTWEATQDAIERNTQWQSKYAERKRRERRAAHARFRRYRAARKAARQKARKAYRTRDRAYDFMGP